MTNFYYTNSYFCRNLTQKDFNEILINGDYNRYFNSSELERVNSMLDKREDNIDKFNKKNDLPFYQFIFSSPFFKNGNFYINVRIVKGVNCETVADFDIRQYLRKNEKDNKGFYWYFNIKDVKNEIFLQYLNYFHAISGKRKPISYTHRCIYALSYYDDIKDNEIDHINCISSDNNAFNLQALDKETHTLKHQDELNHVNIRRIAKGYKPMTKNKTEVFYRALEQIKESRHTYLSLNDFNPPEELITTEEINAIWLS